MYLFTLIDSFALAYLIVDAVVCLNCHKKIPLTGWFIQHKCIFSQFWMLGSLRSRCCPSWFSVRAVILACRHNHLLIMSSHSRQSELWCPFLFLKGHLCSLQHFFNHMEMISVSTDRWWDKEDVAHIDNGIRLIHKKDKTLPFAITWVDLESIMLRKLRQKKTKTMISLTRGI